VRLAGTPEDEPRTDLHVEVGTPPWKVGKLSEDRPFTRRKHVHLVPRY
jgi:hypothetical protein